MADDRFLTAADFGAAWLAFLREAVSAQPRLGGAPAWSHPGPDA